MGFLENLTALTLSFLNLVWDGFLGGLSFLKTFADFSLLEFQLWIEFFCIGPIYKASLKHLPQFFVYSSSFKRVVSSNFP